MKLIIQVPCYNEADTLAATLRELPRKVEGFDVVEWLVIDDGSTDGTADVARTSGADHVIVHAKNRGLAHAFITGIDACLRLGADVIVNTDADNQYHAGDVPKLVRPILDRTADLVIGTRPISEMRHFPLFKRVLQRLGSRVVRLVSGTAVPDAPSGFRAMSREAALHLNVFSDYTYTIETIIQAGQKDMAVASVPVRVNETTRPSRLVKSVPDYVRRSLVTIIRIFVVYRPFRFFLLVGLALFGAGFLLGLRFLCYFLTEGSAGHVQSLILASVLLGIGFQTMLVAFLADLLAVNRRLMEDIQYRLRKAESDKGR